MKDIERLDLLKEIGGTRVYEERRRESLRIMQETGKLSVCSDSKTSLIFRCMHGYLKNLIRPNDLPFRK